MRGRPEKRKNAKLKKQTKGKRKKMMGFTEVRHSKTKIKVFPRPFGRRATSTVRNQFPPRPDAFQLQTCTIFFLYICPTRSKSTISRARPRSRSQRHNSSSLSRHTISHLTVPGPPAMPSFPGPVPSMRRISPFEISHVASTVITHKPRRPAFVPPAAWRRTRHSSGPPAPPAPLHMASILSSSRHASLR